MRLKNFVVVMATACAFVGLLGRPADAAVISFDLNYEFSGGTPPAGPAPWVRATFSDLVGGGVELRISTLGLTGSEIVSGFYFNFDPAKNAASFLGTTPGTGSQTAFNSIGAGNDAFKADGDGDFDFRAAFAPPPGQGPELFVANEEFVWLWNAATGLTTADFNFTSVNGPAGKTGFHAAAHIQRIGPNQADSGWIGDRGTPVPAPGTLALLGLGLVGLGLARRRRHG